MSMVFKDLQDEVKRRATRNQSGNVYDDATKNIVNSSLFRLARTAKWRQLRREGTFETVIKYTKGTGAGTFINGSKVLTVPGATFITDNIQPGRLLKVSGDSYLNTINEVNSETQLTVAKAYGGSTHTGDGGYQILAQEEYNLPPQVSFRCFLWHEEYGFPYQIAFITDQLFLGHNIYRNYTGIVTHYRMWGEDMVQEQLKSPSVITVSSTSSADVNIPITVFGTVSGFPDSEIINTNPLDGTTPVLGLKIFQSIERLSKGASTTGRVVATGNAGATTVATIPTGDYTDGILYNKVRLYPLPNKVFPINVWYYKDPYRLVNDNDIHELGQEFDEAIILLSASKIMMENNKDEGEKFLAMYLDEVKNLRRTNIDKIDYFTILGGGRRINRTGLVHRYLSAQQAGPYFGSRIW